MPALDSDPGSHTVLVHPYIGADETWATYNANTSTVHAEETRDGGGLASFFPEEHSKPTMDSTADGSRGRLAGARGGRRRGRKSGAGERMELLADAREAILLQARSIYPPHALHVHRRCALTFSQRRHKHKYMDNLPCVFRLPLLNFALA